LNGLPAFYGSDGKQTAVLNLTKLGGGCVEIIEAVL